MKIKTQHAVMILVMFLMAAALACRLASPAQETPVPPDTQQPEPTATIVPELIEAVPTAVPDPLRQWATVADTGDYFVDGSLALGPPVKSDCRYFPSDSAWIYQGETRDPAAYLQVFYEQPVIPTQVNIHLVYYFSGIVSVSLIDLDGVAHEVYTGQPSLLDDCPTVLTVEIDEFAQPVYAVRMDVAMEDPDAFEITAIDAVELVGLPVDTTLPTPEPTPDGGVNSLGISPADVPAGYVYFTVTDRNSNEGVYLSQDSKITWLHEEEIWLVRFVGADFQAEVWLYLPGELLEGRSLAMEGFTLPEPRIPSARLWLYDRFIPLMEGSLTLDEVTDETITGMAVFSGIDPVNDGDHYGVVAVFNQVPLFPEQDIAADEAIVTYPDKALASSELSPVDNSALNATGDHITFNNCETTPTSWKPAPTSGSEWIELYFETPIHPAELNVIMTSNIGAVTWVKVLTATGVIPLDLDSAIFVDACPAEIIFAGFFDFPAIIGVQIFVDYQVGEPRPGVETVQVLGWEQR